MFDLKSTKSVVSLAMWLVFSAMASDHSRTQQSELNVNSHTQRCCSDVRSLMVLCTLPSQWFDLRLVNKQWKEAVETVVEYLQKENEEKMGLEDWEIKSTLNKEWRIIGDRKSFIVIHSLVVEDKPQTKPLKFEVEITGEAKKVSDPALEHDIYREWWNFSVCNNQMKRLDLENESDSEDETSNTRTVNWTRQHCARLFEILQSLPDTDLKVLPLTFSPNNKYILMFERNTFILVHLERKMYTIVESSFDSACCRSSWIDDESFVLDDQLKEVGYSIHHVSCPEVFYDNDDLMNGQSLSLFMSWEGDWLELKESLESQTAFPFQLKWKLPSDLN